MGLLNKQRGNMERTLPLALGILVIILNIVGMGMYISGKNNYEAAYESRQTIVLSEKVLSTLKDAETGCRGYVITHEELFLEPYNAAITAIGINLNDLEKQKSIYLDKTNLLKEAAEKMIVHLEKIVALVRSEQYDKAEEMIKHGEGKRIMDGVRIIITDLEKNSIKSEAENHQKVRDAFRFATHLMILNGITAGSLMFLLIYRLINK